jgi:hypothetical protein
MTEGVEGRTHGAPLKRDEMADVSLARFEALCRGSAIAWGMQRGRAAAPLPRWCGSTTHILRTALLH